MKILTKQYKYSPENLEIYLNGVLLKKDYYKNLGYEFYQSNNKIKFIRNNILNKFNKINNKLVKVEFLHSKEDYKVLDKTYQGYIKNYNELKSFINKMKLKHNLSDNIKIKFIYKSNIKKEGLKMKITKKEYKKEFDNIIKYFNLNKKDKNYKIATKFGDYNFSFSSVVIFGRFDNIDLIRNINELNLFNKKVNPFSGKFNFHFEDIFIFIEIINKIK